MTSPLDLAAKVASNITSAVKHPFYPLELDLPHYLANEWSVPVLLTTFFGGIAIEFAVTYLIVKKVHPTLRNSELATVMWFVMCGTIHLFFEGYYAVNQARLAEKQTLFGQLWKEYALSDSRYLTSNAFVLCMESMTAFFWGPLSFVVAAYITLDHPLRHPLQSIVSLGQLYGLVLYYATSMFDHYMLGVTYWRPEAYYFWFYYFLANFFWMVIPGILLYSSVKTTAEAFKIAADLRTAKKSK